jgi:hypothetical protein
MSTATRTIQDTPMAPYAGLMKSMKPDDMQTVLLFLQDAITEAEQAKRKAEDEFLARKMAEIKVSPRIKTLISQTRLSPDEAEDERTRYILGIDK